MRIAGVRGVWVNGEERHNLHGLVTPGALAGWDALAKRERLNRTEALEAMGRYLVIHLDRLLGDLDFARICDDAASWGRASRSRRPRVKAGKARKRREA